MTQSTVEFQCSIHKAPLYLTIATCLAVVLLQGCVSRPRAVVDAGESRPGSERDTALFSIVVRAVAREEQQAIRVDPRPLRLDPPPTLFVHSEDLADVPLEVVRERTEVLARLGIESFPGTGSPECVQGPGGLSRVPADLTPAQAEAYMNGRKPNPRCVVSTLPVAGACPTLGGADGARTLSAQGCWITRVVSVGSGQRSVYDVVAAPDGRRGWRIVTVRLVDRSFS